MKTGAYYTSVWERAINVWNSKRVFKFTIVKGPAQITIVPAQSDENSLIAKDYVGVAYVDHDATKRIISVRLHLVHTLLKKYAYTTSQRVNVAEHELGHAMGLAHNPIKQSVMYKSTRYVSVQPVDVANVRYLYSLPPAQYFINTAQTSSTVNANKDIVTDSWMKVIFNSHERESERVAGTVH
ncbi:matrixin family metalloprotease [Secundilactobacillus folii]|uniref:matrixin family metalloprotease n=1 Tax=Secundilactobacillus folii TaxID=2678357 RepID=UPI0031B59D0F